jgi:hypothetical protein
MSSLSNDTSRAPVREYIRGVATYWYSTVVLTESRRLDSWSELVQGGPDLEMKFDERWAKWGPVPRPAHIVGGAGQAVFKHTA